MRTMYLLFILCFLWIRSFAGYDSRRGVGNYLTIPNDFLATLLLHERSPIDESERTEEDQRRMSIGGLVWYLIAAAALILIIVCAFLPPTPIEPWGLVTAHFSISVGTLPDKVAALSVWLLLAALLARSSLVTCLHADGISRAPLRAIARVALALLFLAALGAGLYLLRLFISSLALLF